MLPTALLLFLAPQDLPQGMPHPSRVVWSYDLQTMKENGRWASERPLWLAIQPRWVGPEAPDLLVEQDRAELSRFLAGRSGWSERERRRWLAATAPAPVPLRVRVLAPDGAVLLSAEEPVPPARPLALRDLVRRGVVAEMDVEIACDSAIADPVLGQQFAGTSLAIELLPVPGQGWRAELAWVASAFGPSEPIDTGYEAIGGFDRLRQRLAEFGCRALLVPGRPISFRIPAVTGGPLRLELEAAGDPPPRGLPIGDGGSVCLAPTLAESAESWQVLVSELELLGETWAANSGFLAFPGGAAEELVSTVVSRAGLAPVSFELSASVTGSSTSDPVLVLAGEALPGEPIRFARGESAQALVDWDVEVAQASRIADPILASLFDGVRGRAEIRLDGSLDLDLILERLALGAGSILTLSRAQPSSDHGDGRVGERLPDVVRVEHPEVSRYRVSGTWMPDRDGRVRIERRAAGFLGSDRTLVIEARLHSIR